MLLFVVVVVLVASVAVVVHGLRPVLSGPRFSATRLFNKTPLVANGKRMEFEPGSSLFAVRVVTTACPS